MKVTSKTIALGIADYQEKHMTIPFSIDSLKRTIENNIELYKITQGVSGIKFSSVVNSLPDSIQVSCGIKKFKENYGKGN